MCLGGWERKRDGGRERLRRDVEIFCYREELWPMSKVNNYNIVSHVLERGQRKIISPSLIGNFLCLLSTISHVPLLRVVSFFFRTKKKRGRKNRVGLALNIQRFPRAVFVQGVRTASAAHFLTGVRTKKKSVLSDFWKSRCDFQAPQDEEPLCVVIKCKAVAFGVDSTGKLVLISRLRHRSRCADH